MTFQYTLSSNGNMVQTVHCLLGKFHLGARAHCEVGGWMEVLEVDLP